MGQYKSLYTWWVFVLLIVTSLFWAQYNGFIVEVWTKDVTYITSLIAVIFAYATGLMGYIAWKITKIGSINEKLIDRVWFLSEIEMGLAIVGTSLGIILLLGVNSDIDVQNASALQELLSHLWSTLAVAFYPNALGLITSVLMKLMVYFITEK